MPNIPMTDAAKLLLDLLAFIPDGERVAAFSQKTEWWRQSPKNGLEDVNNDGCQPRVSKTSANLYRERASEIVGA